MLNFSQRGQLEVGQLIGQFDSSYNRRRRRAEAVGKRNFILHQEMVRGQGGR